MVEGQVFFAAAVLAGEAIAQKHIEPCECGIECRFHVGFERDDAGQTHLEAGASHIAVVLGDNIDAIEKNGLHRFLPAPERQWVVAQRPEIGVQDQGRKRVWNGGVRIHVSSVQSVPAFESFSPSCFGRDTNRAYQLCEGLRRSLLLTAAPVGQLGKFAAILGSSGRFRRSGRRM